MILIKAPASSKLSIVILLMILSMSLFGQKEFAPIGAEWYYDNNLSHNPPEFGYIKLTSLKDSVIENKIVRVIEVLNAPNDSTQFVEGYEYLHQSADTIWYWKNNQFHMLYNFAMQKGDSILLYSEMINQCTENEPYGWNMVDTVFTRVFNGMELKAYSSIPIKNSVWGFELYSCEIFGNLNYLIPQNIDCVYDGIFYGGIRCYSDPINGILFTNKTIKCDSTYKYPLSVKSFQEPDFLAIYPVPVEQELKLHYNKNSYHDIAFEIIDIHGKSLRKINAAINSIDVSDLPAGTYFLMLTSNNKLIDYEKFIIKK